jgi:hypothetical protein
MSFLFTARCHGTHIRTFATVSSSALQGRHTLVPFQVFDRTAKRHQKDRAAAREGGATSRTVDYVRNEVAERLVERLFVRLTVPCGLACSHIKLL